MTAHDILNNPFLNKGTAFTLEERKERLKSKRRKLMHKCKQKPMIWKNVFS